MIGLLDRQVVFFGGKGGVGKTTCSAAFALLASRRGKRVLLISTDPAHSTSDIFERTIDQREREILPNLSIIEIDAASEASRYIGEVKRDIERNFSPSIIRQAYRQIDMAASSPGLAEVALLDRMIELLIDREDAHDLVVFDTAPSGHTLQLLQMPDALKTWIDALVKHRRALLEIDGGLTEQTAIGPSTDPVLAALERRRDRLSALGRCLTDRRRTSFVLVAIPERLAVDETARVAALLTETGIAIGALIVNRELPEGLLGEFFEARKAQERKYVAEIIQRFSRVPTLHIPQLPRDVYGLAALGLISEYLAA